MDLKDIWNATETTTDELDTLLAAQQFKHHPSRGPLEKLRSNLLKNITIAAVITLGYVFLLFYFPIWQIQAGIAITICFNLVLMWQAWKQYQQVDTALSSHNVLQTLQNVYNSFQKMFRQQERAALLVYPVACTAGFMLGGVSGSGKTVEVFMSSSKVQIALVISIAVLVPACYYLAKWMNKVAFGKYVQQLKQHMDALQQEA